MYNTQILLLLKAKFRTENYIKQLVDKDIDYNESNVYKNMFYKTDEYRRMISIYEDLLKKINVYL